MAKPRLPTRVKRLRNTLQRCRTNPHEPQPVKGVPLAPAHLSKRAAAAWPRVCEVFDDMGILTTADAFAVEALCESYADLLRARAAIDALDDAVTYETTGRNEKAMKRAHPEYSILSDADRRFRMWLAAFGATPADRSRVSATKENDGSEDFGEFLKR